MAVSLILKNSSVEDRHPTANQLTNGEISLNYNEAGAFLSCRDTNGDIQHIGGVKIDDATPGSPSKQALWFQPSTSKLFIYDGTGWLVVASGGGSGPGSDTVDQILAGNGINSDPPTGLGVITLDADLNFSRGLEFVAGQIAIAVGVGLEFDVNGRLANAVGAVQYRGTLDLTSSDPTPTNPAQGDTWVNTADGTSNAVWNPDIPTGTTVEVGDLVIYNGTIWTFVARGLSPAERTDLGLGVVDAVSVEVTSSTGSNVQLPAATGTTAGVLTAADKLIIDESGSMWERNGSILQPVDDTYDVEIGGGDITLANSGDASFAGNVGIGTFAPDAPLTVKRGTIKVTDENNTTTGDLGSYGCIWSNSAALANAGYQYEIYTGANDNRTLSMVVNPDGNVGIGTTNPQAQLDIAQGTARVQAFRTSAAAHTYIAGSASTFFHAGADFSNNVYSVSKGSNPNDTDLLVVDANGNVLIGGTLPSAPNISLNAVGSARFADKVISGADSSGAAVAGSVLEPSGKLTVSRAGGGSEVFRGKESSSNNPTSQIFADGSAEFASDATINSVTVGLGAGSVVTNTAVGNTALSANSTGDNNTAVGQAALYSNSTGIQNTSVGYQSLRNTTEGDYNTAVGRGALHDNITGATNTALGRNALYANTDGGSNTAVGEQALSKSTGDFNTAVGQLSLQNNITGNRNTVLGYISGYYIEGSNNTILGAYQGTAADATLSDTVIISAGLTERMRIDSSGNVGVGTSDPGAKLDVQGDIRSRATNPYFYLNNNNTQWGIRNNANELTFEYQAIERLRIDTTGNVGIGITDPQRKLDVNGTGMFRYGFDSGINTAIYTVDGAGNYQSVLAGFKLAFHTGSTNARVERVRVTEDGDVLIGGTLPSAPNISLNADGSATFQGTVQTTERTITAGAFDLATGNYWTCGAITVPVPTNATGGTSGLVRITAGPVTWDPVFKFPGGSAPTIASFPAIIPFYVESASVFLMGNITEGIS